MEKRIMKMKKAMITICGLTLSMAAQANQIPIPLDQLGDYKTAVKVATSSSNLECTRNRIIGGYALDRIESATSGSVDTDGGQPLLIFETAGAIKKSNAIVTTSSDFSKIIEIEVKEYVLTTVNKGDLRNPRIVQEFILSGGFQCKQALPKND